MGRTVQRHHLRAEIERRLRVNPVVMLLGPRQCGKTTLAREVAEARRSEYFDLEAPGPFPDPACPCRPQAAAGSLPVAGQRVSRSGP
jgi:hypothetical protein